MTTPIKSVFNLIEIFRSSTGRMKEKSGRRSNCDTDFHKDFYCEQSHRWIPSEAPRS
jgi:hypothetical protein